MATVGTAKVTIEADFSKFERDMSAFFSKSGRSAGDALDKGVRSGAESAKKSVKGVGDEFTRVSGQAGRAGREASGSWASEIKGVGRSTENTVKVAESSLVSVKGSGARAAQGVATGWSQNISGVGSSTEAASRRAVSSLSSVGRAADSAGGGIRVSFSRGFGAVGSAASGMAGRLGGVFSGVSARAAQAGQSIRNSLKKALDESEQSASKLPGVIGKIGFALGAIAGPAAMFKSGFDRLVTLQKADIMFRNIGLSAEQTKATMSQLNDVVTGTSVSLADASQTASMLMQAGVKAGKPLNDSIKAMANISAISGAAASDVGLVLMQIKASGKLLGGDAMQLQARGVNVYGYLAESLGKSYAEVKKMGEDGKITYEMVIDAINSKTGSLAKEMGETLPAKMSNFKTAMASLGATILEPFMGVATSAVTALTGVLKGLNAPLKSFFGWLKEGSAAANVFKTAMGVMGAAVVGVLGLMSLAALKSFGLMIRQMVLAGVASTVQGAKMVGSVMATVVAWGRAGVAAVVNAGRMVWAFGVMTVGWVRAGVAAVANAGRIAGAWLLAAPKRMGLWAVAFAQMAVGWVKAGIAATVNAARVAVAWLVAAPKNPVVWVRALGQMVVGWARAGVAATVNAAKIAAAWVVATAKQGAAGVVALGQMAVGWARAGIAATINAAKIAAAWLVSMWPIALVVAAVLGVVLVFKTLWERVEGFRNFFIGVWESLSAAVSGAWSFIVTTVRGAWSAITGFFTSGGVSAVWGVLVDGARWAWDAVTGLWSGLVGFFSGVFGGLAGFFSTVWSGVADAFMWVWETVLSPIYSWIADTWGSIAETLAPVWDAVVGKLVEFGTWFGEFWSANIWPILSKVVDFFSMIGQKIGEFVTQHWSVLKPILMVLGGVILAPIVVALGAVVAAIAAVIGIVGLVIAALTGFINILVKLPGWVMGVANAVGGWFARMWQMAKDAFAGMGRAVLSFWRDHIAPLPGQVGQAMNGVIGWFQRLPGRIKGALSGAGTWLVDTGKNIVQGLMDGIGNMAGKIGSWFLDRIPGWIREPFKKALGIHSPSRVFAGYGRNIGEGLIQGVRSMRSAVQESTQGLAGAAADISVPAPAVAAPVSAAPVMGAPVATAAPVDALPAGVEGAAGMSEMFATQSEEALGWGSVISGQANLVVSPALVGVGDTARLVNEGSVQPAMLGMQLAMNTTGATAVALQAGAWTPSMLAIQAMSNLTGQNTSWNAYGVINPALRSVAGTAWNVLNTGVNPAMSGVRGALVHTANTFGWAAGNIAAQWSQVREATARPVRFAIHSVFNDGIVGMWNSASELLGTKRMATYPVRFKTGGYVRGPGGPKGDKIPALLSDREFVINAKATKQIGPENLAALNSGKIGLAPGVLKDRREREGLLQDKTFRNVASRFQGGGLATGTPAWKALLRGYKWAKSRNNRPYVWGGSANGSGGTDCSGYMSGIADVILGGSGARQWATGNFPGTQAGAWKPGLSAGFAVGITNGGPGGGHTAGTIGGAPGIPPVNVESGGVNSRVKFGTPDAAGANDKQFRTRFSLIVTDAGAFMPGRGGGASMADIIGAVAKPYQEKMSAAANRFSAANPGLFATYPKHLADTLGKATRDKITKLSEEMMGDPGGSGAERWRPMAKRAMARVGFDWRNPAQVNAMIAQIQSESGGNPGIAQQITDINGTGENAGVGLLQIIPTTFAAHRDPSLPNDRRNPFANMVAALRYYKSRYGMDLTTMWGKGHGYDRGGLMTEKGLFSKQTTEPERVLSPRQTRTFDELMDFLGSSAWDTVREATGGVGGRGGGSVRTVEVTQNFYGPVDSDVSADRVEERLVRGAW